MTTSDHSIRAFIAADPGPAVRAELSRVQHRLKNLLDDPHLKIKWVSPELIHLTFVFLGPVFSGKIPTILDVMKSVGRTVESGECVLSDPGFFKRSGALWVGMELPAPLAEFQKRLASELGVEEHRPFKPHFTLGRVKRGRLTADLSSIKVEPVRFAVSSLELLRSELLPDGPHYTVLDSAPLAK